MCSISVVLYISRSAVLLSCAPQFFSYLCSTLESIVTADISSLLNLPDLLRGLAATRSLRLILFSLFRSASDVEGVLGLEEVRLNAEAPTWSGSSGKPRSCLATHGILIRLMRPRPQLVLDQAYRRS